MKTKTIQGVKFELIGNERGTCMGKERKPCYFFDKPCGTIPETNECLHGYVFVPFRVLEVQP